MKARVKLLSIAFLISFFGKSVFAGHGLPIVNLTYTIGTTGITIAGFSDAATCGNGPYWMEAKVGCSPAAFTSAMPGCLQSYLASWNPSNGTSYNAYPYYQSLLNLPGYGPATGWYDDCNLEPYNNVFIPFADLCPGKAYYFAVREVVSNTGSAAGIGAWSAPVSFTVPGTLTPTTSCTPGYILQNPNTSPSMPACSAVALSIVFPTPGTGCGEKVVAPAGCHHYITDTITWLGPGNVVIAVNVTSVSVTAPGTYTVVLRDHDSIDVNYYSGICAANPCPFNNTSTVYSQSPDASFTPMSSVVCQGASINFNSLPVGTHMWSVGPPDGVTILTPNIYNPVMQFDSAGVFTIIHQVTLPGGCVDIRQTTVTVTSGITASVAATNAGCNSSIAGGSATVTVTSPGSGFTYAWSPSGGNGPVASGLSTGIYSVVISSPSGCTTTKTVQVSSTPPPVIDSIEVTQPTCYGGQNGSLTVDFHSGTAPFSYAWSNGGTAQTATAVGVGSYTVTITDAGGCTQTATASVSQPAKISTSISADVYSGCEDLSVTFTASNSYTYLWNFGDNTTASGNPVTHTYQDSGKFNVYVSMTDANGCIADTLLKNFIEVYPIPVADFTTPSFTVSIVNPVINFQNTSSLAATYNWNFGDTASSSQNISNLVNPLHSYNNIGTYIVGLTATSSHGCVDTVYKPVQIDPDFEFFIPNAFTPNNDGNNDTFMPGGIGLSDKNYTMEIFDKWGQQMYSTDSISKGWDGTQRGKAVPPGIYVYKITVQDYKGKIRPYTGHITLIR